METLLMSLSEACYHLFAISPGLALMAVPVFDACEKKRAAKEKAERRVRAERRVKRALAMN